MKILILFLACIQLAANAQSENNMKNGVLVIPLKKGENPSFTLEELSIEPANLFIQSKPLKQNTPHIQLELNISESNNRYNTFLWRYDAINGSIKTNYPKAYQNYTFNLKLNKEKVSLVIDKLDFGKSFFIDLKQKVIIENLEILFENCIGESSVDIHGNQTDAFNTYQISILEENEHKTLSFMSLNNDEKTERFFEWKNYKILILEDSEKALKLKVLKTHP